MGKHMDVKGIAFAAGLSVGAQILDLDAVSPGERKCSHGGVRARAKPQAQELHAQKAKREHFCFLRRICQAQRDSQIQPQDDNLVRMRKVSGRRQNPQMQELP